MDRAGKNMKVHASSRLSITRSNVISKRACLAVGKMCMNSAYVYTC